MIYKEFNITKISQTTIILITVIIFLFVQNLRAKEKIELVNLTIWHPLSLHNYQAGKKTLLSIGMPHSIQANTGGLNINLLAGSIKEKMNGVSINGLLSKIEEDCSGLVINGIGNITKGKTRGASLSGYINLHFDSSKGIQMAGLSNFNVGNTSGVQFSGIHNFSAGDMLGIQLSGGMNISASHVSGLQLSGLFNASLENMQGVQLSIGNYARTIYGTQIGIFNAVGRAAKGVQIGLINYAYEESSLKIGLINVSKETHLQTLIYSSNSSFINFAARFSNKHYYNQIGVGFPSFLSPNTFSGTLNYRAGYSIPIRSLKINNDLGFSHISLRDKESISEMPSKLFSLQARTSLQLKIIDRFSFFIAGGYEWISKYKTISTYDHQPIVEFGITLF